MRKGKPRASDREIQDSNPAPLCMDRLPLASVLLVRDVLTARNVFHFQNRE